ncbi:MAG: cobalamin-dependent protein [bacterium]
MNILFVRPRPDPETIGLQHVMIVEPLELEVLAATIGSDDIPQIIDMILENKPFEEILKRENPDILCVTGYITNVPAMIEYCATAKKINPHVITIVGGVHCEVCPDDLDNPAIDYRIVRNATTAFPQLIAHLHGKGIMPECVFKPGEKIITDNLPAFDYTFPIPNRALTQRYRNDYFYIFHHHIALIKTSFGCPHSCQFCFCKAITCNNYAQRPLEKVIDELAAIVEREIYIVDDDFLADKKRVQNFISENKKNQLNKRYLIYGRADFIANNPEIMADFREIGLRTVIVGIESFFDDELSQYHKQTTVEINITALEVLNGLGIDCFATLIIPPTWDHEKFKACGKMLKSLGIHYVNLQPLTPFPGTGIIVNPDDILIKQNDFVRWDLAHISMKPEKMPISQFYREIIGLYDVIVFQPKIIWKYLRQYTPSQWWRMIRGSYLVRQQYMEKIREAEKMERK